MQTVLAAKGRAEIAFLIRKACIKKPVFRFPNTQKAWEGSCSRSWRRKAKEIRRCQIGIIELAGVFICMRVTAHNLLAHLGFLSLDGLALGHLGLRLGPHNTATPLLAGFVELVVEVGLDGLAERGQVGLVLGTNVGQGKCRGCLLVDQGTQARLALDDAIRDTHLAAKGRKPNDKLDRVDVVRDDDQLGLLGFDQGRDVVQAVLDGIRLL